MKYLYLLKYIIYAGIVSYDYNINNKFVLIWFSLALLILDAMIIKETK